jgi:hypothetical protein
MLNPDSEQIKPDNAVLGGLVYSFVAMTDGILPATIVHHNGGK